MTRKLVKDRAAEEDLIEIWAYSFRNWGEAQAERYLDGLEHGIRGIAKAPTKGTRRDGLREGYWSKRIVRHVVFYTVTEDEVRIRRVLHGSMDPGEHLVDP